MGSPPQNPNWVFDYGVIEDILVPGGELPSLDPPGFSWPDHSFAGPTAPSTEFDDSFGNPDSMKETGLRKRFAELSSILEPGRPPKTDKVAILGDAVRMVTQLRGEAQQLKESSANLQETINELKAEKNELRDEKQRLKAEKDSIERQIKALGTQPSFLPHPAAIPTPFSAPGQVVGGKMMPFVGYPGMSMWQFMPPAAVDTSQDHVLRPPVA
ncbi:hypothetical protein DVH24_011661 [Malus domestica]|uniref:BHLH domain-containing protein n=1 Tax=Malus domestica TaxID=3750 RepID=A0A498JW76_MALDO|nr:hypothetical protein DVH24_011661 [Malus domestica]